MAILANELRIGNWVQNDAGYKWQIEDGWQLDEATDKEMYQPIPLTPEILLKCGFKQGKVKGVVRFVDDIDDIDPADKKKYTYYWDLKVPKNDHVEDLYNFSLVQFGKGADILWGHQRLKVKVKSLHQLQNLYFSLTGQELSYNP